MGLCVLYSQTTLIARPVISDSHSKERAERHVTAAGVGLLTHESKALES